MTRPPHARALGIYRMNCSVSPRPCSANTSNVRPASGDPSQQAHVAYAAAQIEQFQKDPSKLQLPPSAEPPDGPPIGDDEDFAWLPN